MLGNIPAIEIAFSSLTNGYIRVYGDGEESKGVINGIHPVMGSFRLTFLGASTPNIPFSASSEEIRHALEELSTIGTVKVSMDTVGIRMKRNGHENLSPCRTGVFNLWAITFADDNNLGCEPGYWNKCPSNINDVDLLGVNGDLLSSPRPELWQGNSLIEVFEVQKGTDENVRQNYSDLFDISIVINHSEKQYVGIGMFEMKTIWCQYTNSSIGNETVKGSFVLEFERTKIQVSASLSVLDFKSFSVQK